MYAIRSYYAGRAGGRDRLGVDRAGVAVEDKIGHALLGDQRGDAGGPARGRAGVADQRRRIDRITSYNVCYTKL